MAVARALLPQPTLAGRHVVLEPLSIEHLDQLVEAASGDRSTFHYTTVPDGADGMARHIDGLLEQRRLGDVLPYAQRRRSDDTVVGCTRFMNLQYWSGRDEPDEVEVGGTWLSAEAQRSAVNTEAKLLLMTHAFETWQVQRVELCTDARNTRSRAAIERLGATFEGVLRSHRFSHVADEAGRPRDSAVFSVVAGEWPAVRDQLVDRLDASRG